MMAKSLFIELRKGELFSWANVRCFFCLFVCPTLLLGKDIVQFLCASGIWFKSDFESEWNNMLKKFNSHYIADGFVWVVPDAKTRWKNILKLAICLSFGSDRVKITRWGLSNSKCHLLVKLVSADRNMTTYIMSWRSARSAWLVVW